MDKYFLVNVKQDASPVWRAVVKAATAEQAAEAAIAAWEGEHAMAPASARPRSHQRLYRGLRRPL